MDDVTAAGMNGFSVLSNVSENMNDRSIVKAIEEGKRYLKACIQQNVPQNYRFELTQRVLLFLIIVPWI